MKEVLFWSEELKTNLREISDQQDNGFREFDLEKGRARAWDLYKDEEVHVMRSVIEAGSVFPLHDHQESWETILLYSGAVDLEFKNADGKHEIRAMKIGRPAFLQKGQNHKLHVREDSRLLGILIPPDGNLK